MFGVGSADITGNITGNEPVVNSQMIYHKLFNKYYLLLQIIFIYMRDYNSEYSDHKYFIFKSYNEIRNNEICKLISVSEAIL